MSNLEIELIGKEKEHYESLEALYSFSVGQSANSAELVNRVVATVNDWERMMGGAELLSKACDRYLEVLRKGDPNSARILYLYLSPMFFFVLALHKASRTDWRGTVTACGIFCERIVRNLLQELDRNKGTNFLEELKDAKLRDKYGRLKSVLEELNFEYSANLYGSLERIYTVRNKSGPHDVLPPEPVQAKISMNECLPVYLDYLNAAKHLGIRLESDSNKFIEIFSSITRTQPALLFSEDEGGGISVRQVIKDVLYREGFFQRGKSLAETRDEMSKRRFNYDDPTISHALSYFCKGKDAVLTRRKTGRNFRYFERTPPSDYFQPAM